LLEKDLLEIDHCLAVEFSDERATAIQTRRALGDFSSIARKYTLILPAKPPDAGNPDREEKRVERRVVFHVKI
jgi:hypothetical protein